MINVSTGEFFGPFDLLLDLIKKSKYDIYEIQISEITNKYIDTIKELDIPSEEIADFVLIASQLLYIKTKMLLKDTVSGDELEDDNISQEELIRRLVEYKKIKKIIPKLKELKKSGNKKYIKKQEDLSQFEEQETNIEYDVNKLSKQINELINLLFEEDNFKVDSILDREEYSLEKYNSKIKLELIKNKILSITTMLKKVENKSEAIIIFLSILELSKAKNLFIKQNEETNEIIVEINNNIENMEGEND